MHAKVQSMHIVIITTVSTISHHLKINLHRVNMDVISALKPHACHSDHVTKALVEDIT